MIYGSVCSGIEAATAAWHPLGWKPAFFSEIEKFPSAVLAHHYPATPNYGDMTKFQEWPDAALDVLVGGTPCQSFSVAGLRKGLDDPRGNLMLTFGAIAKRYRPAWLVWENVPGVLSSNGGRDFGTFLGMLGELGYGFAYRVLDAQFFGVAQRRRRVFVVGYLGDWRCAAAVLFERHGLQGNPAPRRETGQSVAGTFGARAGSGGGFSTDFESAGGLVGCLTPELPQRVRVHGTDGTAPTLSSEHGRGHGVPTVLIPETVGALTNGAHGGGGLNGQDVYTGRIFPAPRPTGGCFDVAIAFSGQMSNPQTDVEMTQTLGAKNPMAVCTPINTQMALRGEETSNSVREGVGIGSPGDPGFTLQAAHSHAIQSGMSVRRLTPVECERLQGFPDHYTDIRANGKPTPDGPRYKALGNSMAVPVMAWIGERIAQVEAITNEKEIAA